MEPEQRTIVAVDIEGSTARSNLEKAKLRHAMYTLLGEALAACGITDDQRDPYHDRGDGVIMLVRPVAPDLCGQILGRGIQTLSERLAEHNTTGPKFRLRAAIHSGEVCFDDFGFFGEDVDLTMRLLEAPGVKARLRETWAPLVLVVSDRVHHSLVRHDARFKPLALVLMGKQNYAGWVHVPGETPSSSALAPAAQGGD